GVTDLIVYGDCRRVHAEAVAAANARTIAVHVFEEGYLRPGWMTLERGGVNGFSPLPRDPQAIRQRAAALGPPPAPPALPPSGRTRGWGTFMYYTRSHWKRLLLRDPAYPWHRGIWPLTEGLGYARRWLRRVSDARLTAAARAKISGKRYFVLPLQMDADFQLRNHAQVLSMRTGLARILDDFAANAPPDTWLIVKEHPHDNGLVTWHGLIHGERVVHSPGGDLDDMLAGAAGLVTINSTSAMAALAGGVPVKALGSAIYDVPGLTHQGDLAAFWDTPEPPDADLWTAFRSVVIHDALVAGDHGSEAGLALLVERAAAKLSMAPLASVDGRQAA
ncbi:MAG: capsular biosynthesis protein, partial [Pseudomonadota bacterium]